MIFKFFDRIAQHLFLAHIDRYFALLITQCLFFNRSILGRFDVIRRRIVLISNFRTKHCFEAGRISCSPQHLLIFLIWLQLESGVLQLDLLFRNVLILLPARQVLLWFKKEHHWRFAFIFQFGLPCHFAIHHHRKHTLRTSRLIIKTWNDYFFFFKRVPAVGTVLTVNSVLSVLNLSNLFLGSSPQRLLVSLPLDN